MIQIDLIVVEIKAPGFLHLASLNHMTKRTSFADLVTIIGTQGYSFW